MTFLAALRHDGIEALCVFDGSINAECFTARVKQMLCLTLKLGDIVTSVHIKTPLYVRDAIRTRGVGFLFLPPYIPDLNPIEQTFSTIKYCMRMAQARSVNAERKALEQITNTIAP